MNKSSPGKHAFLNPAAVADQNTSADGAAVDLTPSNLILISLLCL